MKEKGTIKTEEMARSDDLKIRQLLLDGLEERDALLWIDHAQKVGVNFVCFSM